MFVVFPRSTTWYRGSGVQGQRERVHADAEAEQGVGEERQDHPLPHHRRHRGDGCTEDACAHHHGGGETRALIGCWVGDRLDALLVDFWLGWEIQRLPRLLDCAKSRNFHKLETSFDCCAICEDRLAQDQGKIDRMSKLRRSCSASSNLFQIHQQRARRNSLRCYIHYKQ